jgi:opacity protein-like surface antigen
LGTASLSQSLLEMVRHISLFTLISFLKEKQMKKLLALALGALLVTLSIPALADSPIDFSGYLRVQHLNHINYNRASDNDFRDSESFFRQRFHIDIVFHATENVDVTWTIRAPHWRQWGGQGTAGDAGLVTKAAFATIRQSFGTFEIGRLSNGGVGRNTGLTLLGNTRGYGLFTRTSGIFEAKCDYNDGITYNYSFGNGFGIAAYFIKNTTTDWSSRGYFNAPPYNVPPSWTPLPLDGYKDSDSDRFGIEPRYTWDGGGASLGFIFERDATTDRNNALKRSINVYTINPAITHSWGAFTLGLEAAIAWGSERIAGQASQKGEGLGLYLDANYNYGAGDVTLAGWYIDGAGPEDDKAHDLVTVGANFYPFVIAYGYVGIGSGMDRRSLNTIAGDPENGIGTNHWAIAIIGKHAINDELSLSYNIGYFSLAKAFYYPGTDIKKKKSLGWEIDLGVEWKVLERVTLDSKVAYMFNGNAYKDGPTDRSPKDTFAWANSLTFSF